MRIWSIHPKYLDHKGLVACWRETLLAKQVLKGQTKGYKNHPQLIRFKSTKEPISSINTYLKFLYEDSLERDYDFNKEKIDDKFTSKKIKVTKGQVKYEFSHLLKKLKHRSYQQYENIKDLKKIEVNPLFKIVDGNVEEWEKL